MALRQADILVSNNPSAYGVVRAIEVAGHKTVSNLDALYAIADCILSDSKNNTGSDAIGQTWYVVSEGCNYRLINWENRKSVSGWEKVTEAGDVDLGDYYTKGETDSKIDEKIASSSVVSGKQDKLTPGEGISIQENVISCTLDTTIFTIVEDLPESPDTADHNKIYLVTNEEGQGNNVYTEYISVQKEGSYVWEELGKYSAVIDLEPYLKKSEAEGTYLKKTDADSTYVKASDLPEGASGLGDLATKEDVTTEIESTVTEKLADYVPKSDIINDLTTGGATKVLSAEQGKVLNNNLTTVSTLVGTAEDPAGDGTINSRLKKAESAIESLQAGSGVTIVQTTGTATDAVMSQKAVTDALNLKATKDVVSSSQDGLMSSEDKVKFDGIFAGNMSLPTPTITGTWSFFNNASSPATITPTPDANNPVIEKGYKAQFVGTYSWTHAEGRKDPTQVQSGSSWDDLPATGVQSEEYDTGVVSANTTVKVGIQAAKTGLMVSGSNVVPASGMDTANAQKTVTFRDRIYYGKSTKASAAVGESDVKGLSSELASSKGKTVTGVTCSGTEYYVYAYPTSLGDLSTIIQDGAQPVLGGFTKKTLSITNAAGLEVELNVYTSNNPGAFTGAKLQFQ